MTPSRRARRAQSVCTTAKARKTTMTSAAEGSGARKPVARSVSNSGTGATVSPLVTIIEMPRKYSIPASVTMKEETPRRVTHNPCQAPITRPAAMPATTAGTVPTPSFTVSTATTTPTSATADPTDRSKLRVTISITALIAARLTIEVCSASSTRLRCVRKVLSVVK